MFSRLPQWLKIALIALVVIAIATGLILMIRSESGFLHWTGIVLSGILVGLLIVIAATVGPQLYNAYKLQKHFKANEAMLRTLPTLMQTGHTQAALSRFENAMKGAPDSAYTYYMKAMFFRGGGKYPEAVAAANKAIEMAKKDPLLQSQLQAAGGQMGQPSTVSEFTAQMEELRRSLGPKVTQMRERREKAAEKRKKKSR